MRAASAVLDRFAEQLIIDRNYCVGSEDDIVRTLTGYCQRLFAGQAFGAVLW